MNDDHGVRDYGPEWEWRWCQFSDLPNCVGQIEDWFAGMVEAVTTFTRVKMAESLRLPPYPNQPGGA